jgi:hypothetical protein
VAVIVLGAGATRGASFVGRGNICLPPLDGDFYTQLQRIGNKKHQKLIDQVVNDTVDMFGVNFTVTMETIFSTLEHTARMVETTGESLAFQKADIDQKRNRLQQAIAAVFEASISPRGTKPEECLYHAKLVDMLGKGDSFISFNYDCVVDNALKVHGNSKWNAHFGYGFLLSRAGGKNLVGDDFWSPASPATTAADSIKLFKLHGSLHFLVPKEQDDGPPKVHLKPRPYTRRHGDLRFTIIPPESGKRYDEGVFRRMWKSAAAEIHKAKTLVVIGYSFPPTDLHSTALFRVSLKKSRLRSLVIVNPDREARRRTRQVLQRGIGTSTRVAIFDTLSEFNAADKAIWYR